MFIWIEQIKTWDLRLGAGERKPFSFAKQLCFQLLWEGFTERCQSCGVDQTQQNNCAKSTAGSPHSPMLGGWEPALYTPFSDVFVVWLGGRLDCPVIGEKCECVYLHFCRMTSVFPVAQWEGRAVHYQLCSLLISEFHLLLAWHFEIVLCMNFGDLLLMGSYD